MRADGLKTKLLDAALASTPVGSAAPFPGAPSSPTSVPANSDRSGREHPRSAPLIPGGGEQACQRAAQTRPGNPRRRGMIITPSIFGLVDPPPRLNMNRYEFMVLKGRQPGPEAPRKTDPRLLGPRLFVDLNNPITLERRSVRRPRRERLRRAQARPSASRRQRTHQTRDAQVENARRLSGPQACRASCIGNSAPSGSSRLTTNSAISSTSRL